MWKGSIYATLPADFDYGNGPLDAATRNTLIQHSEYARENYKRMRRKLTSKARVAPKRSKKYPKATKLIRAYVYDNEMERQAANGPTLAPREFKPGLTSLIIEKVAELIYRDLTTRREHNTHNETEAK